MAAIAQEYSLFEIGRELDDLLDHIEGEIETLGEASPDLIDRFQAFCEADGEKTDHIGRFLRMMEAPRSILPERGKPPSGSCSQL